MGILSTHNLWGRTPTTQIRRQQQEQSTYMLLGQADWILRRSEQVSFSASGSTRRSITFDVVLPEDEKLWLKWRRPSSSEEQISNADEYEKKYAYVGVPITFLGKGDLIHFDVTDGQGNTLHTVLSEDNNIVLDNALNYCLCTQSLKTANKLLSSLNRAMLQQIEEELTHVSTHERLLEGQGQNDNVLNDLREYHTQLEDVADRLEWWCTCQKGRKPENNGRKLYYDGKPLRSENHEKTSVKYLAFNLVHDAIIQGIWPGAYADSDKSTVEVHGLPRSTFARVNASRGGAMYTRVEPPSICTTALSNTTANNLETLRTRKFAALLEMLCSNEPVRKGDTQPHSEDWIMDAFGAFVHEWCKQIDDANIPKSDKKEQKDILRTYLLLLSSACDTYPLVVLIPREQAHDRLLIKISFDAPYRERLIDVINPCVQTIEFAFQTYGARSTHIEVEPLDDMILTDARQIANNPSAKRNARLRARATAGRLHVATKRDAKEPMTRLRLSLMMRRNFIVSFLLWSTMTLLFTGFAAYLVNLSDPSAPFNHLPSQTRGLLGQDNMLAALALVLSLWMARRISTIQHPLVEGISSSTNAFMNINIGLMLISAFVVCCETPPTDLASQTLTIASFLVSFIIWICSICMLWRYLHRQIKDDCALPLQVALPHRKSRFWGDTFNPRSAVMPADKAAFSILESFPDEQRNIAIDALESTMEKIKHDIGIDIDD